MNNEYIKTWCHTKKYVAEYKSGDGGHLFEHIKRTNELTTFGRIDPPPSDNDTPTFFSDFC